VIGIGILVVISVELYAIVGIKIDLDTGSLVKDF
jgi:hypothetical protein